MRLPDPALPIDAWLVAADNALRTLAGVAHAGRPYPARQVHADQEPLPEPERRLSGALMRVNHVGEICAQALYQAQALTARSDGLRRQMDRAAREETDHLAWTRQRLLAGHLDRLPESDQRSRAIVAQMKADEARHADEAQAAGGVDLPPPVRWMMRAAARVMTATAHRI